MTMVQWKLLLKHSELSSVKENLKEIYLTKNVKIGRTRDCDINIPSILVGRLQCELFPTQDTLYIISHAKTNKTYVNKRIIKNDEPEKLHHGYIIGLGVHDIFDDKCYMYIALKSMRPLDETVIQNYKSNESHIKELLKLLPCPDIKTECDSDKKNETAQPTDLGNSSNLPGNETAVVQPPSDDTIDTRKYDVDNINLNEKTVLENSAVPDNSLISNIDENVATGKRKNTDTSTSKKRNKHDENISNVDETSTNTSFSSHSIEKNEDNIQKFLVNDNSSISMAEKDEQSVNNYIESSSESNSYSIVTSPNKKLALANIFASLAQKTSAASKNYETSSLSSTNTIKSKITEIENRHLQSKSNNCSVQDNADSDSVVLSDDSSSISDPYEEKNNIFHEKRTVSQTGKNEEQNHTQDDISGEISTISNPVHDNLESLVLNKNDEHFLKKHPLKQLDITIKPLSKTEIKKWTCKKPTGNEIKSLGLNKTKYNKNMFTVKKNSYVKNKIKKKLKRTKKFKRIQILDSSDDSDDNFDKLLCNDVITKPLRKDEKIITGNTLSDIEDSEDSPQQNVGSEVSSKLVNDSQYQVTSVVQQPVSKSTVSSTHSCKPSTSYVNNDMNNMRTESETSDSRFTFSEEEIECPSMESHDSLIVTIDSYDQTEDKSTKPIFLFNKYHLHPYKSNLKIDSKMLRKSFSDKKQVGFNFRLHIRYFPVERTPIPIPPDRLKTLHSTIADSYSDLLVLEDVSRMIISIIHWDIEWISLSIQNPKYCPIMWKRGHILYKESEYRRQIKVFNSEKKNENSIIRLSPGRDPLENDLVLPPEIKTLHYPTYEAYYKELYRPILLEIWATLLLHYSSIDTRKVKARIMSYTDDENLKRCIIIKLSISNHCKNRCFYAGDLVKVSLPFSTYDTDLNRNVESFKLCFGYVERNKLIRTSKVKDTNNRIMNMCDYEVDILVRYPKLDLNKNKNASISLIRGSRESILSMQGLFDLAHSTLKHIILSPTKRNLTRPNSSIVLTSCEHTIHNELRKFLPLDTEQFNVLLKMSKTLLTNNPSLNVIEGAPGTGKTRLLVWLTLTLLAEYILISKYRSKRILICPSSSESLNSITYLIDIALDKLKPLRGNQCRIVTLGSSDQILTGSSKAYFLHSLASNTSTANLPEPDDETARIDKMLKEDANIMFAKWVSLKQARTSGKLATNTFERRHLERQLQWTEEQVALITEDRSQCSVSKQKIKYSLKCEDILSSAHIIISTVEGLTNRHFINVFGNKTGLRIPICLMDDAHNISEVQSLLPLASGVNKLVLAGDLSLPPPTMKSKFAEELGLHQSLLLRIKKALTFDIAKRNHGSSDLSSTDNLTSKNLQDLTYYKLHEQHRMPKRLTKFANCKLGMDTHYPWDRQDTIAWSLRPYIVFDHSFPRDMDIPNSRYKKEAWLDAEAERAVCIIHSIIQQFRESNLSIEGNLKCLILVPDKLHLSRVNKQIVNFPNSSTGVSTAWAHCIDSILGLEAHIVVLCLGTVDSSILDCKMLALAMSRAKMSFIILGHLDFVKDKRIPLWMDMLEFAEKISAYLPIQMNTSNTDITYHMFN